MTRLKLILNLIVVFLPWWIKYRVLVYLYGYEVHKTAKIGLSYVFPEKLIMGPNTVIGNLTVVKGLTLVKMDEYSILGNLNWVSGYPAALTDSFQDDVGRIPKLVLDCHSAITNRHIIDCTDSVELGRFATFAGFRSQILTHSIDLKLNRQRARPVRIGEYCFIGTGCILLPGTDIAGRIIVAAGTTCSGAVGIEGSIVGVGKSQIKPVDLRGYGYFERSEGVVR